MRELFRGPYTPPTSCHVEGVKPVARSTGGCMEWGPSQGREGMDSCNNLSPGALKVGSEGIFEAEAVPKEKSLDTCAWPIAEVLWTAHHAAAASKRSQPVSPA
ncbi:uncharacterized protein RHO25_006780 [Cercospora beticola]|uniref:Uncharacterized protein n=1 Tax=Cercospora beticola TaxID=122368 RepID=A0ABZ0NRI4_CERBT|nr:hypothetical protein RHO25_006780 [Cercospora beticola]